MKKIGFIIIMLFMIVISSFNCFAKWVKSEKLNNSLWIDENTNTIITNNYFLVKDGDVEKIYYAGKYGFIYINKAIDNEYKTNEKGEVVKDGQVITRQIQQKTNDINAIDSANIVYAQQSESSGRLLKNYIVASQNVEIITEKTINGTKRNNVINFKNDGSFISINTKKYNKIIIKAERDNTNKDIDYELKLVVNGEEEDSLSFNDNENVVEQEFTYKLNDDVDLVMYSSDDSKWGQKGIYITQGRMSKYKEDDDE